jgi:acylphosphatase
MGELVRARLRIRGLVQGVGYRYFVRNTALSLGLGGYVKNVPDGSVEVIVEGDRAAVNAFIDDIRIGPRHASVKSIDVQWEEPTKDLRGFDYAF